MGGKVLFICLELSLIDSILFFIFAYKGEALLPLLYLFNNRLLEDTIELMIFILLLSMLKPEFQLPMCFKGKGV